MTGGNRVSALAGAMWIAIALVGAMVGGPMANSVQAAGNLPDPTIPGTSFYLTGTALTVDHVSGGLVFPAEGGLTTEVPTKSDNDLVQFGGTPGAAAVLKIYGFHTEPFAEDTVLSGQWELATYLSCDTAATDLRIRLYFVTGGARDTTHQYNVAPIAQLVAEGTAVHGIWEINDEFEVKAGNSFGVWVYAGITGDNVNCFLLHNSASNPGFIRLPVGGEPEPVGAADLIVASPDNATAEVGTPASGSFNVTNNGSMEDLVSFGFDQLPAGWNATFTDADGSEIANVTLAPNSTASIGYQLSADNATAGDYEVVLNVTSALGGHWSSSLMVSLLEPVMAPVAPEPVDSNTTAAAPNAAEGAGEESVPGPVGALLMVAMAAAAGIRRAKTPRA